MFVISALIRLRKEDCFEFKANLDYKSKFKGSLLYTARPYLKKQSLRLDYLNPK